MRHIPRVAPLTVAVLAGAGWAAAQNPLGQEFKVNSYTTGQQQEQRIAMDGAGRFRIVWKDGQSPSARIALRTFSAEGVTTGEDFIVSTGYFERQPDIASDTSGNSHVVWTRNNAAIMTSRISSSGGAGPPVPVSTFPSGVQWLPAVAVAADGSALVAWSNLGRNPHSIDARVIQASGQPLGADFVVSVAPGAYPRNPAVAWLPGFNRYVVTWDRQEGVAKTIRGRLVDPAAQATVGNEFTVSTGTNPSQVTPDVASDGNGNFVVVWQELSLPNMKYRRFAGSTTTPTPIDAIDRQVGTTSAVAQPRVDMTPQGDFTVVWASSTAFGRRFDTSGTPIGGEFQLNATTFGGFDADVAMLGTGDFVATWTSHSQDGNQDGVYARRFVELRPGGLDVDLLGNAVWDRNELNAVVTPGWFNFTASTKSPTATLSSLTCPGGFSCSIGFGSATYTIPAGTKSGCSQCYQVGNTVSGSPATHNDATALETLSSGESKTWKLHIGGSFTDVTTASPYYRYVETLLHRGITGGCTGTTYCPGNTTTREQLPVFLLVAKEGVGYAPPPCTTPPFTDVPISSPFCPWIKELVARGVIGGCGGGNYCPTTAVSREQIALFTLKTFDPSLTPITLPPCVTPPFTDVPTNSPFCQWIKEAVSRGIISGCGGGNYCPTTALIRGDMAIALTVTFGLTLYGL